MGLASYLPFSEEFPAQVEKHIIQGAVLTGVIVLSCDRWQLLSGVQGDVHIL
jgi:hypothetical protein